MSGGGLELGVLQPAVSTCLLLQVCFRKLATFGYFIVKGTLIVDMHLLYSLNWKMLSYILGRVTIIRVSPALKQTISLL